MSNIKTVKLILVIGVMKIYYIISHNHQLITILYNYIIKMSEYFRKYIKKEYYPNHFSNIKFKTSFKNCILEVNIRINNSLGT